MDARKLKALLAVCGEFGVTRLKIGSSPSSPELEIELGAPAQYAGDAQNVDDLQLPPGVPDPRKAIEEIYARAAERAAASAAAIREVS